MLRRRITTASRLITCSTRAFTQTGVTRAKLYQTVEVQIDQVHSSEMNSKHYTSMNKQKLKKNKGFIIIDESAGEIRLDYEQDPSSTGHTSFDSVSVSVAPPSVASNKASRSNPRSIQDKIQSKVESSQLQNDLLEISLGNSDNPENSELDSDPIAEVSESLPSKPTPKKKPKTPELRSAALAEGITWLQEKSKIFVCIDLEYYECNNKILTEIGIAVYDPRDSFSVFPKVRSSHYAIKESQKYHNGKYVPDNRFSYSYGTTLVMNKADSVRAVNEILKAYKEKAQNTGRELIAVGQQIGDDLKALKKHGGKLHFDAILDTYTLWRHTVKGGGGSLSSILGFFDIPHGLMHNAGEY